MTREQESDLTQPSEEEGRKVNIPSFHQQGRREETIGSWQNKYIQEPTVTPREIICSFLWSGYTWSQRVSGHLSVYQRTS